MVRVGVDAVDRPGSPVVRAGGHEVVQLMDSSSIERKLMCPMLWAWVDALPLIMFEVGGGVARLEGVREVELDCLCQL